MEDYSFVVGAISEGWNYIEICFDDYYRIHELFSCTQGFFSFTMV